MRSIIPRNAHKSTNSIISAGAVVHGIVSANSFYPEMLRGIKESLGTVDEETIRNYIENQEKEEVDNFMLEEQLLFKYSFKSMLVASRPGSNLQAIFSRKKWSLGYRNLPSSGSGS